MGSIGNLLKKGITNPAIIYLVSRYGTYIIQFINSLFIAVYLGPYYLGIWGFINLVIGYIGQLNLGISHSVNVIISINKHDEEYVKRIIGNGLSMVLCLSFLFVLFFIFNKVGIIQIGNKYNFSNYIYPITIIAVLTHLNALFSNIFRIFGKIHTIAINQSLYPIIVLFVIPFFRGENLLWAMLITNSVAFIISFALFLVHTPVKIKPLFQWEIFKIIQIKGWHLFIYNTSFYLILLTTKSFISGNFRVEEYGYFTFSYSLANAVLLLLNALSFLVFPKMLNRFANADNKHIKDILGYVRTSYISTSHLLIHFLIMIFPFILLIFPDYSSANDVFKVTALTVVLYTNSFGYQAVLMARGRERKIAIIAFCALLSNVILVPFFVFILNIQFSFVMFATMIVYLIYVLIVGATGRKELGLSTYFTAVLRDIFPLKMFIPFILTIVLILITVEDVYFMIPFIVYIILNYKDILKIKELGIKVINNPDFINI